jgi:hypothetical protein
MQGRRCQNRVRVDLPLQILCEDGAVARGRATDLSVGGMRVETDAPLAIGSTAVAQIRLPGSTPEVSLPAVVRWTRDGAAGLQFGLLGARATYLITEYTSDPSGTIGAEDVAWVG